MRLLGNVLRFFSNSRSCVVRGNHISVTGTLHEADSIPNQDQAFEMLRPNARTRSGQPKLRILNGRRANGVFVAGVFDGHGPQGETASCMAAERMQIALDRLLNTGKPKGLIDIVREAFQEVASALNLATCSEGSGSTGSVVVVKDDDIVIANVGDSSVMLVSRAKWRRRSYLRYETRKHRPTDEEESTRILASGGHIQGEYVIDEGGKNGIAVSRTLGDRDMQQFGCISDPEVRHFKIRAGDAALLLASDGLWDVPNLDYKEVAKIAARKGASDPQRICEKLLELASIRNKPADDCTIACLTLN